MVEAPGAVTGINPHAIASGSKKKKGNFLFVLHAAGKFSISGETAVFRTSLSQCIKSAVGAMPINRG